MNNLRNTGRIFDEQIENSGVPTFGDKVPPLEEDASDEKALVNPQPLTNGDVRPSIFQMDQVVTTQAQAMMAKANREVVPRENKLGCAMASRLRDFTKMNLPTFYGSKVE